MGFSLWDKLVGKAEEFGRRRAIDKTVSPELKARMKWDKWEEPFEPKKADVYRADAFSKRDTQNKKAVHEVVKHINKE